MKIWLLCKAEVVHTSYSIRRFLEEAEGAGVEIDVLTPEDFDIVVNNDGLQSIHVRGKRITELPDCVMPRMGAGTTYFTLAILRHLERLGVYCFNSSEAIEISKDKLASLQQLSECSIKIPKTMFAKMPLDIKFIAKEFKFPVVLKKISGSQGKGIVLCKTKVQLLDTIELVDEKTSLIVQEYIKSSRGRDLRVFVVGRRVIGAMLRKAGHRSFKANFSKGGSVERVDLTPEMEWLAIESASLLGLECAGVDLLFSADSLVVCEVNSSPGFKGFELATGINVPKVCYEFLKIRVANK